MSCSFATCESTTVASDKLSYRTHKNNFFPSSITISLFDTRHKKNFIIIDSYILSYSLYIVTFPSTQLIFNDDFQFHLFVCVCVFLCIFVCVRNFFSSLDSLDIDVMMTFELKWQRKIDENR